MQAVKTNQLWPWDQFTSVPFCFLFIGTNPHSTRRTRADSACTSVSSSSGYVRACSSNWAACSRVATVRCCTGSCHSCTVWRFALLKSLCFDANVSSAVSLFLIHWHSVLKCSSSATWTTFVCLSEKFLWRYIFVSYYLPQESKFIHPDSLIYNWDSCVNKFAGVRSFLSYCGCRFG